MLTYNASKVKNSALPNITYILNVLSENGIIFSEWAYFLRSKNNVNFTEGCVCMRKYACQASAV